MNIEKLLKYSIQIYILHVLIAYPLDVVSSFILNIIIWASLEDYLGWNESFPPSVCYIGRNM